MNGQKYIALHMNFKNFTNTKWTEEYILSEVFLKFTVSKFFISNKMQINIRYHRLLDIAYKLILIRSNQG